MGPLMGSHSYQGEVECCSLGGNITSSRLFLTSYLTKKSSNNTQNDWSHYSPPCPVLPPVWSGHPAGGPVRPCLPGELPAALAQRGRGHLCLGGEDNLYPRLCP